MHEDHIRNHIAATGTRPERETLRLTLRMVGFCWPGGSEDHSKPAAREWLARWRPAKAIAQLPACGCARGYCVVCN